MKREINRMFFYFSVLSALLLFSANTGLALVARTGELLEIGDDEVINEDLYLAGDVINIGGTVNGSLYAAGGTVTIHGYIRDNAVVFAREVVIRGDIGSGVKAAGYNIIIEGNVAGDLLLAGSNVNIGRVANIGGDVLFGAGKVSVDGPIEGFILGGGRTITINNKVNGDVKLGVRNLTISESANIGGDLTYISDYKANIHSGAEIRGTITHRLPEYKEKLKRVFPFVLIAGIVGKIFGFLMALVVGLVLALLAPGWMKSLTDSIAEKPGPCAGWGALILFAVPFGIIIAFITIVGIPLGMIVMFLYLIALYISQITVGLLIGRLIIGRDKSVENRALIVGAFVLGLFILKLFMCIPVVGYIIGIVAALFGLGAMVISEAARREELNKTAP